MLCQNPIFFRSVTSVALQWRFGRVVTSLLSFSTADDVDVDVGGGQAKKKRVVRPQPKLNGDRLCGPRGIAVLEQTFAGIKFSGKGHEKEDLKLLMTKMEHWAHRLFPKMPFDNVLERIEKIGKTKQVNVSSGLWSVGLQWPSHFGNLRLEMV